MPTGRIVVSATGFPQFVRLIDFLAEVLEYAIENVDMELREMAADCHDDLLCMGSRGD